MTTNGKVPNVKDYREFVDELLDRVGPMWFVLDKDHKVKPAELMEWAEFFDDLSNRRVALDEVGPYEVSTVFLGIDHGGSFNHPLLFETMVFDRASEKPDLDLRMSRYRTWDEAVAGHAYMLKLFQRFWRYQCR